MVRQAIVQLKCGYPVEITLWIPLDIFTKYAIVKIPDANELHLRLELLCGRQAMDTHNMRKANSHAASNTRNLD